MVTHDFNEAIKLADIIHIMIQGEIKETKTPKTLFTPSKEIVVNQFLQCNSKRDII